MFSKPRIGFDATSGAGSRSSIGDALASTCARRVKSGSKAQSGKRVATAKERDQTSAHRAVGRSKCHVSESSNGNRKSGRRSRVEESARRTTSGGVFNRYGRVIH